MKRCRYAIQLVFLVFAIPQLANSQAQMIDFGKIPNRYIDEIKTIPINSDSRGLHTFIINAESGIGVGAAYILDISFPYWQVYGSISDIQPGFVDYFHSPLGISYLYDPIGERLCYAENYGNFECASSPGRPVITSMGNIHLIADGPGDSLTYIYSSDTLHTYQVCETFMPPADFVYLINSPDNSLTGAIFYSEGVDSIYKYLTGPDEPLNLSTPTDVVYCQYGISHPFDIILDSSAKVNCVIAEMRPDNIRGHFFWSESAGIKFLREAWDDIIDGPNYEISFGAEPGEIMITYGPNAMDESTKFYYSSDAGDIWYQSQFEIWPTRYSSVPRNFADSLHLVYFYYSYEDGDYATYYYPLRIETIIDEMTLLEEREIQKPISFSLSNYPNPFNSSTTIDFDMPDAGQVSLAIYDISGRLVRTLFNGVAEPGSHSLVWDGRDASGMIVSSGIYFYSLESTTKKTTNRMLLLK